MRRASLLGLLLLASTLAAPASARQQPPKSQFSQLFDAYSSGDPGSIERTLKTPQDYQDIRKDLRAATDRWRRDWQPIQAVFLLEVFKASLAGRWPNVTIVELRGEATDFMLARSRTYLTGGRSREEMDAFERQWHKAMLAVLHKYLRAQDLEEYLQRVDQRIWWKPRNAADPRLIEPHLILGRAIAREQALTPDTIAYYMRTVVAPIAIGPLRGPSGVAVKKSLDDALLFFDQAGTLPTEAAEASVRKAFLLHRLGRQDDALMLLADIERRSTDPTVVYWGLLFRGRALQLLGRPEEAVKAYEAALQACPQAQAPAVALATLSLQLNRQDDAFRWATTARTTPHDRDDPWWSYWLGDGRFVDEWLGDLRKAAR
jgi:tetratricopeptide (TPR) repeat protein